MDVKIPTKCGRCGRTSETTVSIEEASTIVAGEKARMASLDAFTQLVQDADVENLPDVIVLKKNGTAFDVEVLENLCELDGKRNKGCKARVSYLIEDMMFRIKHEAPKKDEAVPEGDKPKRTRRTKAEIEAAKGQAEA
jgi:hypothetical protein